MSRNPRTAVAAVGLSTLSLLAVMSASPAAAAAPTKGDCKQGGHSSLTRADGSGFRNQGACVSHAARGGTLVHRTTVQPTLTTVFSPLTSPTACAVAVKGTGFLPNTDYSLVERRSVNGLEAVGTQVVRTSATGTFQVSGVDVKDVIVTYTVPNVTSVGPKPVTC